MITWTFGRKLALGFLVPSVVLLSVQGVSARLAFIPRVEKRIESHVLHLMVEF